LRARALLFLAHPHHVPTHLKLAPLAPPSTPTVNVDWKPGEPALKSGDALRRVADGQVATLATFNSGIYFSFAGASSPIVVDPEGRVFFGDYWSSRMLQYTPATGVTFAGIVTLPLGMAVNARASGGFSDSLLVSGAAWEVRNVNRSSLAFIGPAFGPFVAGSIDGVLGNLTGNDDVAAMQPGALAFDSKGNLFVAHTFHDKIMRVGTLRGDACNLAIDSNSAEHRCRPGTYIDWDERTCKPCSSIATVDVFPFSSYCQDAQGRVIAADATAPISVDAVAGISVGAIAGGVGAVVALLAVRAYYIINQKTPTLRRANSGGKRSGSGARVVESRSPTAVSPGGMSETRNPITAASMGGPGERKGRSMYGPLGV